MGIRTTSGGEPPAPRPQGPGAGNGEHTHGGEPERSQGPEQAGRDGRARARYGRPGPASMIVMGSACTSSSGMFIKLSAVNAGTAAFLRCALAMAVLAPLAFAECRRLGPRPWRLLRLDLAAGALLGVDYVCWVHSIHDLGASIATVLLNVQLVVFPLLARVLTGIRLERRFWLTAPVMLAGVALAGGALGRPEPGSDPLSGVLFGSAAGVAFAGYLFLIRLGGDGGRTAGRASREPHTVTPVAAATLSAAASSGLLGAAWTGVDIDPGWPAWGWLIPMALLGQVLAWLLINPALPRLAPARGAALLLLQPVLAVAFGVCFLAERPTPTQYAGCALVVFAVWRSNRTGH
ncbi:Permease of the drug/metabolite transporter (DMT) superfamily [Streptomyces sp. WMMB 714]|uniref:DMT family transporter n=1 Tax=Streptomyces sp. WMMB 714 TaxID=1286822 RepID=UPI000823CABA|nr:Permease of the drug/metabolite transporter (DMT) superfamily [Streptomyces sp. WMMB 714]